MDFYYSPISPPCNTIRLVAKALGVQLNLKEVDLFKQEHLNRQVESTAHSSNSGGQWLRNLGISCHTRLSGGEVRKGWFPLPQGSARSRPDQSASVLWHGNSVQGTRGLLLCSVHEQLKKSEEALGFLSTFLEGKTYVAGDRLTIADISLIASIANFTVLNLDLSKYPNIQRWYENAKKVIPGWEVIDEGLEKTRAFVASPPKF